MKSESVVKTSVLQNGNILNFRDVNTNETISLALIGGGDRGNSYLKYLQVKPEYFKLAAIAEPVKEKRDCLKELYNVPENMCFEDYHDLLALPKIADIAMICTQDKMHFEPAMKAIEKGYDFLLEKPIAPTPEECFEIAKAAEKNRVKVLVCHVLRYTPLGFVRNWRLKAIRKPQRNSCINVLNSTMARKVC